MTLQKTPSPDRAAQAGDTIAEEGSESVKLETQALIIATGRRAPRQPSLEAI